MMGQLMFLVAEVSRSPAVFGFCALAQVENHLDNNYSPEN